MPIPLVDFPPIVRRLLWVFVLSSLLMQIWSLSIGDGIRREFPHRSAGPPALLPADHREKMAPVYRHKSNSTAYRNKIVKQ